METINIQIEDGSVNIEQNCTHENFMSAVSVMFASMTQNSSNTIEELLEILEKNALDIIENNYLNTKEKEGENDI
jgi:hypothetical protein